MFYMPSVYALVSPQILISNQGVQRGSLALMLLFYVWKFAYLSGDWLEANDAELILFREHTLGGV
jgi:hypothetical protein